MNILRLLLALWFLLPAMQVTCAQSLDAYPDVVYVKEFSEKSIKLKVTKAGIVFASKKGGRQRGALKVGSSVELVGFTDNAYQIRGKSSTGNGVSGWVSPLALTAKDKEFVKKFKAVYERQVIVKGLIAQKEIAIGMTEDEVAQVLGEPTKTKVRRDAEGATTTWEFVEYEIEKHYANYRDPVTGGIFRQLSHTTKEEASKTIVEFENGAASTIEQSEDKSKARSRIVTTPMMIFW